MKRQKSLDRKFKLIKGHMETQKFNNNRKF